MAQPGNFRFWISLELTTLGIALPRKNPCVAKSGYSKIGEKPGFAFTSCREEVKIFSHFKALQYVRPLVLLPQADEIRSDASPASALSIFSMRPPSWLRPAVAASSIRFAQAFVVWADARPGSSAPF
jgi:hypothetical protein